MDFAAIARPAFGTAAQHLKAAPKTPHTSKAEARYQRAAKTAATILPDLPLPGTAHHVLMIGAFDLCQVIAATVPRLPDCTHLRIATLCYSKRNVAELCGLLDRHKIALTLLVSAFFRDHNKELHERAVEELREFPGVAVGAARSHCKITCFDSATDTPLVFEGSANLRTNGNREQLTAIRDRPLHDWHAAWIDELVRADGEGD